MSIDIVILRDTLETALASDDDFAARFYATLFSRHPEVKPLFHRNSEGAQQKMFAQKLTAIVDHVGDAEWTARELPLLARSHAEYGAKAEMYPLVGAVLIDTLRQSVGDAWTPEAEKAWGAAYEALSRAILAVPPEDPTSVHPR